MVYIGTSEGPVIITVIGITGTFSGGSFTPVATLTPFLVLTLRALKECSISRGCNAFGINAGVGVRGRLAIFLNAGLSTISMYAASGADLNELVQFNDVNSPSLFLLYHLATAMQTAHISVLVGAGASVNAEADNGWTPLFQVANNGGISAIMAILTLSANANHTDNENRTPLHIAAAADNAAAVSALLETGTVDINARDIAGWTPLHFAAGTGTMAAGVLLTTEGISLNALTDNELTPLDFAILRGDTNRRTLFQGMDATLCIRYCDLVAAQPIIPSLSITVDVFTPGVPTPAGIVALTGGYFHWALSYRYHYRPLPNMTAVSVITPPLTVTTRNLNANLAIITNDIIPDSHATIIINMPVGANHLTVSIGFTDFCPGFDMRELIQGTPSRSSGGAIGQGIPFTSGCANPVTISFTVTAAG